MWLAYSAPEFWRQAVANLPQTEGEPKIWRQAVAKLASRHTTGDNTLEQPVPETEALRQLVAEVPWGHNLVILNKLTNPAARLWYLLAATQFGWSRRVLLNQIKAKAY